MKNIGSRFILFPILLIQLHTAAQKNMLAGKDSVFIKNADPNVEGFNSSKRYYISVWEHSIPSSVKIIRKIDEYNAIIEAGNKKTFDSLSLLIKIAAANDNWKLSSAAEKLLEKKPDGFQKIILTATNTDELIAALKNRSQQAAIIRIDRPSNSVLIQCKAKFLKDSLLPLNEVIFIDVRQEPHPEIGIIGYDRSFHGINAVDYNIPGANGKNIVAGVKEQNMQAADLDLYKRVLPSPITAPNITNHATVIASIIGGAGNSFYDGRGIANGCTFFPSSFDNLFADDTAVLHANKVMVQNHSYGTVIQQFYGAEAVSYDALAWANKNYVAVFSAGNQGDASASDGKYANLPGYANITGNFKMAKNIITVGAIDNKEIIPLESSAGPLYDGRVAPQLLALGPNGTSDAAAIVSGTVAVMQQVYADSNNNSLPAASLIKAVLYNSADDIYHTGIDYKTGYGLLNSHASIKALQQKKYDAGSLSQNQQWTKVIAVPASTAQLKITLSWTDTPASINNNKAIVNDLDLEVKQLGNGTVYKPWVLNTAAHADSLSKTPTRKRDSLNTAEQVSINLPAAGDYEIKVIGTNVSTPSLPFHVAYDTDTLNSFAFTSPQHASDANRQENETLSIRWKTFVADSNETGDLYISYNSGTTWELLKQSIKIYSNKYLWPIKDTNSIAVLKMETAFGSFLSKAFIISKVTQVHVDFLCSDSFQISWNKHVYAGGYKIFTLTDSPYLKPILSVSDTFALFHRSAYPYNVYAVEPVLNNGLGATRSIAMDVTLQGIQCFYKTLYYTLLDQNKLDLILELSTAAYIDSVYFEKVSSNGQLLATYGGAKVTDSKPVYNQLVNTLQTGTTYIRVRIKLKSGAIVYTEIISVLTSGPRYILLYPNPAKRNGELSYSLQQGFGTDSQLQFFDMSGRLLKSYSEMPDKLDISKFAPGMYIYKLLDRNDVVLETGKLLLQ